LLLFVAFLQALHFEPAQPELFGAGANFTNAWADYDGDGDPDLFVGFDGTPNRFYRNERGVFSDVATAAGIADARSTRAAAWGDFDADGDPDLLVGFTPASATAGKPGSAEAKAGPTTSVLRLYRNDGGKFVDHTAPGGLLVEKGAVRQPAWIDFDGDNDLDLFVAFRDRPNALFRNDPVPSPTVSRTVFRDIAADVGLADARRTVGAVWFDFDQDGDLDLAVANMDGDANGLFRNDGGRFTDVADAVGIAWGGRKPGDKTNGTVRVCAPDVNNDGRFDLFFANYGKNGLFLNNTTSSGTGTGTAAFSDASAAWGIDHDARYDACVFDDFDNDGRIDFYVNGTVTGGVSYPDFLFRNMGDRFADVTPNRLKVLHADHGAQWADYDNDGDVDLALTGAQPNGMHLLFTNMLDAADAQRSLKVRVVDARKRATRAGAEVRVLTAGTSRVVATRLVDSGTGYDAQNDLPVHIGLSTMAAVDVEVVFPRGGKRVTTKQARVDPRSWRGKTLTIQVE
jgi:hypothetical protein